MTIDGGNGVCWTRIVKPFNLCNNFLGIAMIQILKARLEDMEAILKLQYAAFHSEALIHNDFTIQPLTQTLEESIEEYHKCVVLKACIAYGEIVGSIRAYLADDTAHIGKVMVHPDHQGKGLGRKLLAAIEREFPGKKYELRTSSKSERNLYFYETSGYVRFREDTDVSGIKFVYLRKEPLRSS
ncbi:MAG: GNAT family N-acetyltransferase [Treponema sp.]|nr:GNAT family N-acetyltransferase [Treponema sp.]